MSHGVGRGCRRRLRRVSGRGMCWSHRTGWRRHNTGPPVCTGLLRQPPKGLISRRSTHNATGHGSLVAVVVVMVMVIVFGADDDAVWVVQKVHEDETEVVEVVVKVRMRMAEYK